MYNNINFQNNIGGFNNMNNNMFNMNNNMNNMNNNMNNFNNNMNNFNNNMNNMNINMNNMNNNMNNFINMNNNLANMNNINMPEMNNIGNMNNNGNFKMNNNINMNNLGIISNQGNFINNNMNNPQQNVMGGDSNFISQMSISYRNIKEPPKEIIPRGDVTYNENNPFPEERSTKIANILLVCPSGHKVNVRMPLHKKVCDLFNIFVKKIGINEAVLDKQIYFFYEAGHLDHNDQRLISEVFKKEHCTITVIDPNNVIGA